MQTLLTRAFVSFLALSAPLAVAAPESPSQSARKALPVFLKIVAERPSWASRFRVQAVIREHGESEVFFLSDFRSESVGYSARLDTTPTKLENIRAGHRVAVMVDDINDWTYDDSRDGTTHGHFGICAELRALPRAESKFQKAYWRLSCKP